MHAACRNVRKHHAFIQNGITRHVATRPDDRVAQHRAGMHHRAGTDHRTLNVSTRLNDGVGMQHRGEIQLAMG